MSPILTKAVRDLWAIRGRVAFMVLALAAGLTSLGTVSTMRDVVLREMTRAYRDSTPASATLDVGEDGISDADLAWLRARAELAGAERRATLDGRYRTDGGWQRAKLFVVDDFASMRMARLGHERGASIPGPGEVLLERSAVAVTHLDVGDEVTLSLGRGDVRVRVGGIAHEPALAPASTEQAGYFYLSPDTLSELDPEAALDEVRVLVAESPFDVDAVERQVLSTLTAARERGISLHEVRIPPPGAHPHERPSQAVLLVFNVFAGLTTVLAAVLTASLLALTLARQVREIGILKTLGATRLQVAGSFAVHLLVVSGLALAVSAGPTLLLGQLAAGSILDLLNIEPESVLPGPTVPVLQAVVGLTLPLLVTAPAVWRASATTVRQALADHGAPQVGWRWPRPLTPRSRWLTFGLDNALRVPRRSALTVGLLAVGGALFVTALSVASSWDAVTDQVLLTRHYDVEVHVDEVPTPLDDLAGRVEVWRARPATFDASDGVPISRTYPDEGHGTMAVLAGPLDSTLVDFHLLQGRLLSADDRGGLVLNQLAAARVGPSPVGQRVTLWVDGQASDWTIVGVVQEVAAPAQAYVTPDAFDRRFGDGPGILRLADPPSTPILEQRLAERGSTVQAIMPLTLLYNAMGEHVLVLVNALVLLSLLMAGVGALALGSTMSTVVVERSRELGVLAAVGASPGQLRSALLVESGVLALASLPLSLLLAVPLSAWVGQIVGDLAFALPLPLRISWSALGMWGIGVLLGAVLAVWLPASWVSRRPVAERLRRV